MSLESIFGELDEMFRRHAGAKGIDVEVRLDLDVALEIYHLLKELKRLRNRNDYSWTDSTQDSHTATGQQERTNREHFSDKGYYEYAHRQWSSEYGSDQFQQAYEDILRRKAEWDKRQYEGFFSDRGFENPFKHKSEPPKGKRPWTQVLGVKADASRDEIMKAYRHKAQKLHPDKGGATEAFQELQAAKKTALGE